MEGLRDIKEIVEVNDHSFLLLIASITLTLLLVAAISYLLTRKRRRRPIRPTPKERSKGLLDTIDYSNAKEAAYLFEENTYPFVTEEETEEEQETHKKIIEALMPYKYKKEVPELDKETTKEMKAFIERITWKR